MSERIKLEIRLDLMAVRAAQSLVHPRTFGTVDGGLPGDMWLTFLVCFAGIALLWVTLVSFELTAKRTRGQLSRLRRTLDGSGSEDVETRARITKARSRAELLVARVAVRVVV